MTGKSCSPNTVQWTYDNWAAVNGVVTGLIRQGSDT